MDTTIPPPSTSDPLVQANPEPIIPWLACTPVDMASVDLDAPLRDTTSASCDHLATLYREVAEPALDAGQVPASPSGRAHRMLSAVLEMIPKHLAPHDPFGPLMVFNGGRTAVTADFSQHVEVLAVAAGKTSSSVVRARLCDVVWLLERKRADFGLLAVHAYLDTLEAVIGGKLTFEYGPALGHEAVEYMTRALVIGRALGEKKAAYQRAWELARRLRDLAASAGDPYTMLAWFALESGFSPAEHRLALAADMEAAFGKLTTSDHSPAAVDLQRMAAGVYRRGGKHEDASRCSRQAAELLVSQAEAMAETSAMMASNVLGEAIATLAGSSESRDRRKELRHRLVDLQSTILDEMSPFSTPLDLREAAELSAAQLNGKSLRDKLFAFICLGTSPDPEALEQEARENLQKWPLASLFGSTRHDADGKVIYRSDGVGFGKADEAELYPQIVQSESIRRHVLVGGGIEAARNAIACAHHVDEQGLARLLSYSPAVPLHLNWTFATGFARFFQGDLISATYILTPLLEASLRHVLKLHGHDVSTFDDASRTQEDRTISSLFDHMRPSLDLVFGQALTTDIENVFLRKPGPHIRHALSHGLLIDGSTHGPDAIYACWLIFRICLIPILRHRNEIELPAAWIGSAEP